MCARACLCVYACVNAFHIYKDYFFMLNDHLCVCVYLRVRACVYVCVCVFKCVWMFVNVLAQTLVYVYFSVCGCV